MSGFLAWGSNKGTGKPCWIWPWRPMGFGYRTGENRDSRDSKQNFVPSKTQRKGAVTPQIESKLPVSVGRSSMEAWVRRRSPQRWGYWRQKSWKDPLGISPLGKKVKVKSLSHVRLFVTLWTAAHQAPPGSSSFLFLQARIQEWVAISFSRGSSQPRDRTQISCIAGKRFNLWARARSPQVKQLPGRSCNPTSQQIVGLNLY